MNGSRNEWGRLRRIMVGSATGANWPSRDPVFSQEFQHTQWQHSPVPQGPVAAHVIEEANQDLDALAGILGQLDVQVVRPKDNDFAATDGMYNYCPRDRVLIDGTRAIDVAMMYPCRDQEIEFIQPFLEDFELITMPRGQGLVLDAANICRFGDDWLFLQSRSGNRAALEWLRAQLPDRRIHACSFYGGVHIDSTVIALREGLVMLNASRVQPEYLPDFLQSWDKIWIEDCVERDFYQYPYASKWIGMNILSVDDRTVIVDEIQTDILILLERRGFTVIPTPMRQSRTLGGGLHCVTLDLWRQHE
jgi:scyllo-inosamine-4-phosphate amidinotransferase 1